MARAEEILAEKGYPADRRTVRVAVTGGWGEGERLFVGRRS